MESAVKKEREMEAPGMEYVACNLCGADDAQTLYDMPDVHFHPDERFTVVRCRCCGLGYLNPRPRQEELDKYYPATFYDEFEIADAAHQGRYAREAGYVLRDVDLPKGRKPKLLDIGCANGGFPRYMLNQGWDVEGLEIGASARKIADFKLHNMLFSDFPQSAPAYDVLTSWAVLEHVHDPMAYFKKAGQILRPGGIFAFLVTNVDSLSSQALYKEDVPRHTYFYNVKTVRAYLDKADFELVRVVHSDDIYGMQPVGWLVYKINHLLGRPKLSYEALNMNFTEWTKGNGLPRTPLSFLKYAAAHPVFLLDRLTMPLYARWQKLTGNYGISTYVVRKKQL